MADQLSFTKGAAFNDTDIATTRDWSFQYNKDISDKYLFVNYRQVAVYPTYCCFQMTMIGLGLGKTIYFDKISLFSQIGYYLVDNNVGTTDFNEPLHYYFEKFGPYDRHFQSYTVHNENALGLTVGLDIPMGGWGIKTAIQIIDIKMDLQANLSDPPTHADLKEDPMTRSFSSYRMGVYINF